MLGRSLKFNKIDDAETICDDLEKGCVHLAVEVRVHSTMMVGWDD